MKAQPLLDAGALALAFAIASTGAMAQDRATTLTRLARSADVVVRATVMADASPSPALRRLTFRADQVLHGTVGATFSLTEPAGACCGRSLFALQVGEARLLFLDRLGPRLHLRGGARGVLPVTAALITHVQALIAAPTTNALGRLLVANLDHDEPRIADDAALALATVPNLGLDASERVKVTTALDEAVRLGSVRSAPLADVIARLADATMVDAVLPAYLEARREDQARLLRAALRRCPPGLVADGLPVFVGESRRGNLRAAHLLAELPTAEAQAAMTNLLRRPNHPQVQLHLCEGLLGAGLSRASLEPLVHPVVLDLAVERRNRRPTFRNIDPRR